MPAKNIRKKYLSGAYYHIYNRGAWKKEIFIDKEDYKCFLRALNKFLSPTIKFYDEELGKTRIIPNRLDLHKYIKVYAFCLMSNHFHILVKQDINERAITDFMRRLCSFYASYFNKKYNRSGVLFQGRYRASLVGDKHYLIGVSRYIHRNPIVDNIAGYRWSSYHHYIYKNPYKWLDTTAITEFFGGIKEYREFVEDGPSRGSGPLYTELDAWSHG